MAAAPSLVVPYDPDFLGGGFRVPLPTPSARLLPDTFEGGRVLDYVHYSLAMHARRRTALFSACNVDASRMVRMAREGMPWLMDPRLPAAMQLGPSYYSNNAWDRGHLTRRQDALWGPVRIAREANAGTFYYTNAAPQHENFNQDEWAALEDWVLEHAADLSYRLCVITGPVLQAKDPALKDAQVPAGFWKLIALRDATADGEDLSVVAFFMKQTEMSEDKLGRELLELQRYQVTVAALEKWTGLDFGPLRDADELAWSPLSLTAAEPEQVFRPISGPGDIVFSGDRRRAAGGQVQPLRAVAAPVRPGAFVH
jgi:DNA/RNA endonuclease G (NUC1)